MTTIRYQLSGLEVIGVFLRHCQPQRFIFWWRVGSALLGLGLVVFSRRCREQIGCPR